MSAFADATYQTLFGATKPAERAFAEDVLAAVAKIDRGLLTPPARHPLGALIAAGARSVDALLDHVDAGLLDPEATVADEQRGLDAVDALANIFLYAPASPAAIARLRAVLRQVEDGTRVAILAKTLAIGRDEELLFHQMRALADDDPGIVASAARLVGYGKYRPALPILLQLVSPRRFFESRSVLWAIGEIGSVDALDVLARALSEQFRVPDALMAVGKLRDVAGFALVMPWAAHGTIEQKDAAWRALAMITDANRGAFADVVASLAEAQLAEPAATGAIRLQALLCLARAGRKLSTEKIKRALGVEAADARTLSKLMLRR
jgi:hypothetical protein